MTLTQFFEILTNTSATITIIDSDDTELVKIVASGYEQLLADTLARTVAEVTVSTSTAIKVKLESESDE